ncbi:hypothetical protein D3C87_2022970 [compost metagenome]
MDEATFADIDPGVADLGTAIGGEEHQIAGLQAFLADTRRLHADHLAGGARQGNTSNITVDVADQPAAIKP